MSTSRREFLSLTLASYAMMALGHGKAHARQPAAAATPVKPMRLLILGGTGFLGPATIEAALARGHHVTMFNRGRSVKRLKAMGQELPFMDKVEKLYGNRDPNLNADANDPNSPKGLEQLAGKSWDAVIDNSGFVPRIVKASADLLAANVKHYTFISSVSVYADHSVPDQNESAALATLNDPTVEDMGPGYENYGPLKALCEKAAEAAMPGKVANVRPGFIVGPLDPTPRFTYWPVRASQAVGDRKDVLVPTQPNDPVQIIDVRDLGEWLVRISEESVTGVYNALGPANTLTTSELMNACKKAAGTEANFAYVGPELLRTSGTQPESYPIVLAPEGEYAGFHRRSNAKAIEKGLTFRPVVDTCRDTLAFYNALPEDIRTGLSASFPEPNIEAKLLSEWRAQRG